MLYKFKDENTPLLIYVTKYRVCFWNMNTEHFKKRASKNVLQKIVQEKKFPELTGERAKLKIKKIVLQILLS